MSRKLYTLFLLLAVAVAFVAGAALTELSGGRAQGQTADVGADKILVQGHGNANSSEQPPGEQFTLTASNAPHRSFKVIPPGKTFILTDMVYNARGVKQNLTVNLSNGRLTPEIQGKPYIADILLQTYIKPGEGAETHLCTGYVIPSGHSVMAWTNAGLEPGQWVQVAVTGYLIDERKP
jgi:hypothetical protein